MKVILSYSLRKPMFTQGTYTNLVIAKKQHLSIIVLYVNLKYRYVKYVIYNKRSYHFDKFSFVNRITPFIFIKLFF